MGEHVEINNEYCTVLDDFDSEQRFTIVPVSEILIIISDHIYNMTHEITFEKFFAGDFDLAEWLREEILLREDEIALTATRFGDGLWDNTWTEESGEESHDDKWEDQVNNPLHLNTRQSETYRLATVAHNRQVDEFEDYGTPIRRRFPLLPLRGSRTEVRPGSQSSMPDLENLELNEVKPFKGKGKDKGLPHNNPTTVERNSVQPKDFQHKIPKSIVVEIFINNHPFRALIHTGSLADFISSKIVDLLKLSPMHLAKPLPCQLAASGSRTMITCSVDVELRYQDIAEMRHFDIINLENYDIILGTPFLYQHKVLIGFNPPRIIIGSTPMVQMDGSDVIQISSLAATVFEEDLLKIREQLRREASDLCKSAEETPLPPLRAINHRIPLKEENKTYPWRPSRCPEAIRHLWNKKRDSYLKTGRWKFATGQNASPMLILHKKPGPGGEIRIRTVLDKRQVNENTRKMVSPLPNMETILSNVLRHRYRTLIDGKDAYEQIRIEPSDVPSVLPIRTPSSSQIASSSNTGRAINECQRHFTL